MDVYIRPTGAGFEYTVYIDNIVVLNTTKDWQKVVQFAEEQKLTKFTCHTLRF